MFDFLQEIWLWVCLVLYIVPILVHYVCYDSYTVNDLYEDIFPEQGFICWIASWIYWCIKMILDCCIKIIKIISQIHDIVHEEYYK